MIALTLATIIYCGIMAYLYRGLSRHRTEPCSTEQPFVSIIIPARNEEDNIVACLNSLTAQNYPQNLYEIIVIDDQSTDKTNQLVQSFIDENSQNDIKIVESVPGHFSPKKQALKLGIEKSRGEIIFTTDADCIAPPNWLNGMVAHFDKDTGLAASWLLVKRNGFFSHIEFLDSLSFVFIAVSAFGLGKPFLANGANLAYRKETFTQNNGFDGVEHIGSGDDDLFLQKVMRQKKWQVKFITDPTLAVYTNPCKNVEQFFKQRARWASKNSVYPFHIVLLEAFVYLYFAALLVTSVLAATQILLLFFLIFPAIKFLADFLFMRKGLQKIDKKLYLHHFMLANLFQMVYILFIGLAGLRGNYSWKDRSYKKGQLRV